MVVLSLKKNSGVRRRMKEYKNKRIEECRKAGAGFAKDACL
jgi:hypothetical protein